MVAPEVESVIVTVTGSVPEAGEIIGVAACGWVVYVAVVIALLAKPLALAIALTVPVEVKLSENDPPEEIAVPCEPGTGVLPSVV